MWQFSKKGHVVSEDSRNVLEADFLENEVKHELWAILGDKSPGPDGYESQFFKDSWRITGKDLTAGVLVFLRTGKMLQVINNTVITLIPKGTHAESVGDYRPIACCNIVYKITLKMLCQRLIKVLPTIILANQSSFVEGKSIAQNILICQDLVRLYNMKKATKSCLIKIDLKKAYDLVEWRFVEEMIHALNFPCKFIGWIMNCITTT